MKILIATPLYPPEIAPAARYVKELARRLSNHHEVTILAYGHLPEKIPGVSIIMVDKHAPRIVRLLRFFYLLIHTSRDCTYALNGISVELPLLISSFFVNAPYIFCTGDAQALKHAERSFLFGVVQRHTQKRALRTLGEVPNDRPEILPLEPKPTQALEEWESAWKSHCATLLEIFKHARK